MSMKKNTMSGAASVSTAYRSYGCKNCGYKSYEDDSTVYCGFCMKKILIELGIMKDESEVNKL